jgi:hypothetical protein
VNGKSEGGGGGVNTRVDLLAVDFLDDGVRVADA